MNGCQLAGFTARAANTMNRSTTASLMKTMTLLVVADSLMPMTRSVVTSAMMTLAGRGQHDANSLPSAHWATAPRAADGEQGASMPALSRTHMKHPDPPLAH